MDFDGKTVLVTGVGGNVGQGVIRNIRHFCPKLRIVGTDIAKVTAGHYFLDAFYTVPYSYHEDFSEILHCICAGENISLIIPTTDYEVYYISLPGHFPPVLASPPETTRVFLDKYLTFTEFKRYGLPFPDTCLPSQYTGQIKNFLVKPREGRGSRDIHIQPANPRDFDDRFIVQEIVVGQELTTAFYVRKNGKVHGMITFSRELASGMTERCEVVIQHNQVLEELINAMVRRFAIRGPCNLQSIVTRKNELFPFEVNCRYSGTNSIRSQLGFTDVYYGIQEYLLHENPAPCDISSGSAIRLFMDIVYPGKPLDQITPGKNGAILF